MIEINIAQSFKKGGLRFNKDNRLLNPRTKPGYEGIDLEVEAYQTQFAFDGSFHGGASAFKDINRTSVFQLKNDKGQFVYENLRPSPLKTPKKEKK